MSPCNILIISLILSISFCEIDAQVTGFHFVLQWPNALCSYDPTKCNGLIQDFTIHGLWPHDRSGVSLTDCRGTEFNLANVLSIESDLNRAWPSFRTPWETNRQLWKYEWDKHGKCSESILDQASYFRTAVARWRINLLNVLARATTPRGGIVPSNTNTYRVQDILNAIPSISIVNCKTVARQVLYMETFLCLNTATTVISCVGAQQRSCGGTGASIRFLQSRIIASYDPRLAITMNTTSVQIV